MSCHSLLAWSVFMKDQLLWESSCVLFVVFPLLLLIFVLCVWSLLIWLICVLRCFILGLSCLGLSRFLGLGWLFRSPFQGSFQLFLLKCFLMVFFLSSSGTPMIWMFGRLTLSQRSLRFSSFLFIIFSSLFHLFLPFNFLPHLSNLLPLLFYCWFPPKCFWSHLLHYSLYIDSLLFLLGPCWTFLASSQSLSPGY